MHNAPTLDPWSGMLRNQKYTLCKYKDWFGIRERIQVQVQSNLKIDNIRNFKRINSTAYTVKSLEYFKI